MVRFIVVSAIAVCISAGSVNAQAPAEPFGFRKGMSLAELRRIGTVVRAPDQPGAVTLDKAPAPHSAFESYLIFLSQHHGLCKIAAIGKTIQSSAYGENVRQAFSDLADALEMRYGKPSERFDHLRSGSIWNEPRDWMMGLAQKERTLAFYWVNEPLGTTLPPGLIAIGLTANALSSRSGYVTLTYEFDNFAACRTSVNAKENEVL